LGQLKLLKEFAANYIIRNKAMRNYFISRFLFFASFDRIKFSNSNLNQWKFGSFILSKIIAKNSYKNKCTKMLTKIFGFTREIWNYKK